MVDVEMQVGCCRLQQVAHSWAVGRNTNSLQREAVAGPQLLPDSGHEEHQLLFWLL